MKNLLTAAARGTAPQFIHSLLTVNAVGGAFCTLFLFVLCFVCVHLFKYANIGWKHRKKPAEPPPPPEKTEKEKAPAPPQEPIYYIVERKRTRAKPKYSEPKEIRFK